MARSALLEAQDAQQHLHALPGDFGAQVPVTIASKTKQWVLRSHRRNKVQKHTVGQQPHTEGWVLFSAGRITACLQNPVEQLSFSVGPTFFVGSMLFVLGTSAQTHQGYWTGEWSTTLEDNLVNIPFFIGAVFFLLGCYAAFIEASNIHYSERWHRWQVSGAIGDPPKIHMHPLPTEDTSKFLSYYGALIQFVGSVMFLVGATTELVGAHRQLSDAVATWLLDVQFLLGGLLFVVGAYLLVSEGSQSWWRGCAPPLRAKELRSLDYWIGILNWTGSLLFLAGGVEGFVSEELDVFGKQLMNSFTWLLGSILFAVQGVMLYLEMINVHPTS